MSDERSSTPGEGSTYRLEVEGRVGPGWREWFGADRVEVTGSSTVIEVRVADQSELYGRLRRIHDLNLRLTSLTRLVRPAGDGADGAH